MKARGNLLSWATVPKFSSFSLGLMIFGQTHPCSACLTWNSRMMAKGDRPGVPVVMENLLHITEMSLKGEIHYSWILSSPSNIYCEKHSQYCTISALLHQSKRVEWFQKLATSLRWRGHIAYSQELKIVLFALPLLGAVEWNIILFARYSSWCNKLEEFSINTWSLRIKDKRLSKTAVPNGPSGEH